jgi:hypothetical protein
MLKKEASWHLREEAAGTRRWERKSVRFVELNTGL